MYVALISYVDEIFDMIDSLGDFTHRILVAISGIDDLLRAYRKVYFSNFDLTPLRKSNSVSGYPVGFI